MTAVSDIVQPLSKSTIDGGEEVKINVVFCGSFERSGSQISVVERNTIALSFDVEAHTATLKVQCCCKLAGVGVASDSPENDELVGRISQVSVGCGCCSTLWWAGE